MTPSRKRTQAQTLADRLASGGQQFAAAPRIPAPTPRRVTATLASAPVDTNKESAIREKKALGEAYRRRQRQNRHTRWGSKLWT